MTNWKNTLLISETDFNNLRSNNCNIEVNTDGIEIAPNEGVIVQCETSGNQILAVYNSKSKSVELLKDIASSPNKDLALLHHYISDESIEAVVVDGFPGVGKTSSIMKYALNNLKVPATAGAVNDSRTYHPDGSRKSSLFKGTIEKIYITRPDATIGTGHGFLPGDLREKLTPLFGSFIQYVDRFHPLGFEKLHELGCIEMAPLTYIQGRDLDNSIIIADEFQNCDDEVAIMFLTRPTDNSRTFILGDTTKFQIANKKNSSSKNGLEIAHEYLRGAHWYSRVEMRTLNHILRGKMVRKIVSTWLSKVNSDNKEE
ncbi:putative regulatory protein [Bacillus phage vB_BceM-HSE3]|nr:putative regulatory protein [Bacillus phage vB_BceM-HSE3]